MSVPTAAPQPAPHSALRRLVARHPVASFLVMVYTVNTAVALSPLLTRRDILPFDLAPYDSLGHIFGVALPAFIVVAAMSGKSGVQDLARRSLRWRVGVRWYLIALLGVPMATVLGASAIFGLAPLNALVEKWELLLTVVLPQLVLLIVFFNLAEEVGWTGFLQARLQVRHGPLKASVIVTVPFALFHLPGWMVEFELGLAQLHLALLLTGVLGISQLFGRLFIMWLYNNTNYSVLLVGMFHSSFNVTTTAFGPFIPVPAGSTFLIAAPVVAVAAVLIVVFTRGRLSYRPELVSQPADAAPGGGTREMRNQSDTGSSAHS
jgi:membrane protease YdiL (CAAX protease family)